MKKLFIYGSMVGWVAAVAIVPMAGAQQNAYEVALVGAVEGEITVHLKDGVSQPIAPFSKISSGARIDLSDHAKMQIIYINQEKNEAWQGKSSFNVGVLGSKAISGAPESTKKVPSSLVKQLASFPNQEVSFSRSGTVRLRNISGERLKEIREIYEQEKSKQEPGSYLAEASALNLMSMEGGFAEMKALLAEINAKEPPNSALASLSRHYQAVIEKGLSKTP